MVALAILALSPIGRPRFYEFFLQTHRAAAVALGAMLWLHLKSSQSLSWALLIAGTSFFGGASALQFIRQVYISLDNRLRFAQIQGATKRENEDSYLLEIRTARTWKIRPGTYVLLTVLNWRYVSFLQRHPLMIVWYDDREDESSIYVIIQAQKGWTSCIDDRLRGRKVWLDGPYGSPYDAGTNNISEYDTVLLIAEESGIYAHLLLLRSLVEDLNRGCTKSRRVVLMWNTTGRYHKNIQTWLTELVIDTNEYPTVSMVVLCRGA